MATKASLIDKMIRCASILNAASQEVAVMASEIDGVVEGQVKERLREALGLMPTDRQINGGRVRLVDKIVQAIRDSGGSIRAGDLYRALKSSGEKATENTIRACISKNRDAIAKEGKGPWTQYTLADGKEQKKRTGSLKTVTTTKKIVRSVGDRRIDRIAAVLKSAGSKGMTYEDIANVLGESPTSVSSCLSHPSADIAPHLRYEEGDSGSGESRTVRIWKWVA
ncbi:MAG: hypothetical protein AB7V18_19590 [Pyrinomonadaceae bacterium]